MPYKHHTVPIGGAPFVPPSLALYDGGGDSYPGASYASSSSERSSSSSPCSSSPSSSSSSASSSSILDASHSYPMTSSPSSSSSLSCSPPSSRQRAAFEYSRRLHEHTASMWQMERHNIEKAKLQSPGTSPSHRPRPISAGYIRGLPPPPHSALQPAAAQRTKPRPAAECVEQKERTSAIDALLGRSWGRRGNGHQRNKTVS